MADQPTEQKQPGFRRKVLSGVVGGIISGIAGFVAGVAGTAYAGYKQVGVYGGIFGGLVGFLFIASPLAAGSFVVGGVTGYRNGLDGVFDMLGKVWGFFTSDSKSIPKVEAATSQTVNSTYSDVLRTLVTNEIKQDVVARTTAALDSTERVGNRAPVTPQLSRSGLLSQPTAAAKQPEPTSPSLMDRIRSLVGGPRGG